MKPSKFSSIMPQVAIEIHKLIDLNDLVCLIGNNVEEIYSFLVKTAYGEDISKACGDRVEPELLEEALYQNYARTFNKMLKYSSRYMKKLLLSFLRKFDAMNLKTMIRMLHAQMNSKVILEHIIPLGTYDRKKCQIILSEINSLREFIDSLNDQDLGFILKEKLKDQKIIDDLTPLEVALDKEVFRVILNEINNLSKRDKKIATDILGIEIDVLNIKIILKYKALRIDNEKIKDYFVPAAMIDEKILDSANKETDIKSMFQLLLKFVEEKHPVYQILFSKLVKESESPISRLEFILDKAPFEMCFFKLKKNQRYYNIGYILAFLNLKWVEIKNLRSIINGVTRNIDRDKTLDLLILPESFLLKSV